MTTDPYTLLPNQSVDELRARLNMAPPLSSVQIRGEPGHLLFRVIAPDGSTQPHADSPDINDTFPCPGSPGCL